ncbi:MAG: hypothetical protein KGD72_08405 [Candidatus Lokiarchaeota archaeon]|nr:hypothetical protein [Candidatus Lokiarchaeota archaeon]
MKDFHFSLNLGLIGTDDSRIDIILDYLKEKTKLTSSKDSISEFQFIYENVPLKMKIFHFKLFEDLTENINHLKKFDVIIVVVNLYNDQAISKLTLNTYKEFCDIFMFNGIAALVGIDPYLIEQNNPPTSKKINEIFLIQKTKELKFHYCFKIQNSQKDISDIFNKVLNNVILKLEFINPEMFERVKTNGKDSVGKYL